MRALARFLGPSPRRVKRLVNAYRLIKARMSDAQLSTFVADRKAEDGSVRAGPYQIVIALLVIGTGAPAASAQILQELAEWDPQDSVGEVVDHWKARNQPDWMMAAQVVEMLMQTQNAKDVAELRGWARKVRRYLLSAQSADLQLGGIRPATVAEAAAVAANENGNETANGTVAETQAPEDSRGGALPGGRGTSWR
jgi:hypothetical protein